MFLRGALLLLPWSFCLFEGVKPAGIGVERPLWVSDLNPGCRVVAHIRRLLRGVESDPGRVMMLLLIILDGRCRLLTLEHLT